MALEDLYLRLPRAALVPRSALGWYDWRRWRRDFRILETVSFGESIPKVPFIELDVVFSQ
jgi:hypothetical protein